MYDRYGDMMNLLTQINELAQANNGILTFSQMINNNFSRREIKQLEENQIIERISKGIYLHKDYLKDTFKINQLENSNFIYSHETAAYLHGLTDRFPRQYSITTYSGYHLRKSNEFNVFYTKKENLNIGVIEIKDNAGNLIKTYDKEKTICDLIKNKKRIELQVYTESIQNYFKGKVNLNKISEYAKILNITDEVFLIINLMMKQ